MGSVLVTHAYITFDASTPDEFIDLVRQTLEQSEFIETEWYDIDGEPDDVLLIQEVKE